MTNKNKETLIKANRTHLSESIIKKLFALAGNQRAMPECSVKLVYEDIYKVRAVIRHIDFIYTFFCSIQDKV